MSEISKEIMERREHVNIALRSNDLPLLAISGPCAPTIDNLHIHLPEGEKLRSAMKYISGLVTIDREPIWKPRSDPLKWPGMLASHGDLARALIEHKSRTNANVAIEFGNKEQVEEFSPDVSFAWIGGRNELASDLDYEAAVTDPLLPLGKKNGLSGEIDAALKGIERMRDLRGSSGAEIALIYRGGENAKTPEAWEVAYKDALARTDNRLIVDVAHGGEMAHDPSTKFTKSVIGQLACLGHVLRLAEEGFMPAGIHMESSDARSPIDPVIPFKDGINGIVNLRNIMWANYSNV